MLLLKEESFSVLVISGKRAETHEQHCDITASLDPVVIRVSDDASSAFSLLS